MSSSLGLPKIRTSSTLPILVGIGLAWILWRAICTFGNRQFGGYDHSVLVDTPYRLLQGQRPFVDFYFTTPPLFAGGAWWAFYLLGPRWDSLIQLTGALAVAAFATQTIQFRCMGRSVWESMGLAFAFEAMTLVTGSYWWYNPLSLVVAGLLLGQCAVLLKGPSTGWRWSGFSLLVPLVLLSKPNSAALALGVSFLALSLGLETRRRVWIFGGIGFLIALGLLHAWRMNPLDLLAGYMAMAGRGTPAFSRFSQDRGWFEISTFLVGALGLAMYSYWRSVGGILEPAKHRGRVRLAASLMFISPLGWLWTGRILLLIPGCLAGVAMLGDEEGKLRVSNRFLSMMVLSIGTMLTGLYSCFTNAEPQLIAFPLLASPFLWTPGASRPHRIWQGTMGFGALAALFLGWTRYRVELIGPGRFYQDGPMVRIDQRVPFFKDFEASPIFGQLLADLRDLLDSESGRVFFGPRMEWAYAAFNRPSPVGLPIWWDPEVSYPVERTPEIINRFREAEFDLCVFFRGDFTRMPVALRDDLLKNSSLEVRGHLLVLRSRTQETRL